MKTIICFFVLVSFFAVSYSWTAMEQTDNTKEHPGHCFSKNEEVGAMEKGEVKLLKSCSKAVCSEGGLIEYFGCGSVGAEPPCKVVEDPSKPYPDCCPDVKC